MVAEGKRDTMEWKKRNTLLGVLRCGGNRVNGLVTIQPIWKVYLNSLFFIRLYELFSSGELLSFWKVLALWCLLAVTLQESIAKVAWARLEMLKQWSTWDNFLGQCRPIQITQHKNHLLILSIGHLFPSILLDCHYLKTRK